MPKYQYNGQRQNGSPVKGVVEAVSADAAAGQLMQTGVIPIAIEFFEEKIPFWLELRYRLGMEKPGIDDLILFCRQCYSLSKSGVPIIRGLKLLGESCRNRRFAEVIENMANDLEAGRDLSTAMSRYPKVFSPLFVNIIRVGETSGKVDEAFMQLYRYFERDKETVKQIKAAVRYPMFVLIAIILAVIIIMTFVIPKFAEFYSKNGLTLPLPTRIIMGVSHFMVDYWYVLFALVLIGGLAFRHYIDTRQGRLWWDEFRIRIVLIGDIILRATLGRLARTLAMALKAGVPILQAITATALALGNEYMTTKVIGMREGIERGENLTRTAAKSEVFTPLVLQMISIGEETGQLDDMLEEVAEFYDREVEYDIKNINSIIEPLLTVGIAGLILVLMLGVFLPMWDLVDLTKR